MKFIRPKNILAGYWVDEFAETQLPELHSFGEHWTPEGWTVDKHQHDYWELYYQANGSSRWLYPEGEMSLASGQAYLVSPGTEHRSVRFSSHSQHFYFLEFDLPACWGDPENLPDETGFLVLPHAHRLEPLLRLLLQEAARHDSGQCPAIRHLLALISLQLKRLFELDESAEISTALHGIAPEVWHARDLLETNPGHAWRLDELGRICGLSPHYLSTRFRKAFGMPPLRYLQKKRIERASQYLQETDLSMTTIAGELGYSSSQHFSARFRKATGQSPTAFRKSSL